MAALFVSSSIRIFLLFYLAETKSPGPLTETCRFSISPKSLINVLAAFLQALTMTFILAEVKFHLFNFLIYSNVLVSKIILSSELINGGTIILIPFSNVAGLYEDEAVCPLIAASVVSIFNSTEEGKSTDKVLDLHRTEHLLPYFL